MISSSRAKLMTVSFINATAGTGTATIRVKDINDMPPQFTKSEWYTEVDETEGLVLPEAPILTVTVLDEDETNKFHYKVNSSSTISFQRQFIDCKWNL